MAVNPKRRARPVTRHAEETVIGYLLHCPGCNHAHMVTTDPATPGPRWGFNGDLLSPTFTPSLLCYTDRPKDRCHSFIENGRFRFLTDCGHHLAGQTVDIPQWDEACRPQDDLDEW